MSLLRFAYPATVALGALALGACASQKVFFLWGADFAQAAPLDAPLDLLADDTTDEWLLFTPAEGATFVDVATLTDGVLTLDGAPQGYVATRHWYRDYALEFEWRWPAGEAGNSGLLIHATTPLVWYGWPRCIEVQLKADNAGDFILMGGGVGLHANLEDTYRDPATPEHPEIDRRVEKLEDGLERALGEWNHMRVECLNDTVRVHVNGVLVNSARGSTVTEGAIAFQSEGTPIAFRGIRLTPLETR